MITKLKIALEQRELEVQHERASDHGRCLPTRLERVYSNSMTCSLWSTRC